MLRKWLIGSLILLIGVVFAAPALANGVNFADVQGHWAEVEIARLSSAGYINGYPDKTFRPERNMSKAEFITILIACKGIKPNDTTTANYWDTNNHWAKAQINEAVKLGILVPGEDPNGFRPDESVLRSQAAAWLVRALGEKPDNGKILFNDKASIERSIYSGYIKTAYDLGLISGFPNGNFEPFQTMTRAQVSTVFSRYLDRGSVSTPIKPGGVNTVVIDDKSFDIYTTPVYFKINFTDIKATSLAISNGKLVLNGNQIFDLEKAGDNPDIIINNNRYGVEKMAVSGNQLIIYPNCRKVERFTYGGYSFGSDYVKLYINSVNSEKYLSDLEIIDEYRVRVGENTYYLDKDKITIALNKDFYDITKIVFDANGAVPVLSKTDPVIFTGISVSDLMAIFTGASTLNLNNISNIDFILDGKRYNMSQVIIDAKGNFSAGGEIHSPKNVMMIISGIKYTINHIEMSNAKFVIYAGEGDAHEWVLINDEYRHPDDIQIIWEGKIYDLDEVLIVSRDCFRISGKQYKLDGNFKVCFDSKTYDVERLDYDLILDATIIKTGSTSSGYMANQPKKYVFFKDGWEYQEGTGNTFVYANRTWIEFGKITILDPSHFTYKNTNYDLIDARVKLGQKEFYVIDTAWHGLDKVIYIYVEE